MSAEGQWERYREWLYDDPGQGFRLDVSRMGLQSEFVERMTPRLEASIEAMRRLEGGAVANPDEERMVGHYWLRAPELAPTPEIGSEIRDTLRDVVEFAGRVRSSEITTPSGESFEHTLIVGIGGSALGPQFVADALGNPGDRLRPRFLDNTDPDGITRVLRGLGGDLSRTLTVVISKSGGTPETRNGMLEAAAAYRSLGLELGPHAVAVTGGGSKLDDFAEERGFLRRFPMWDWVGGRTSVMSAVGLLPAALQGIDVDALLRGAAAMDRATRAADPRSNPAALLALAWYHAGDGRGTKDMVVLPYKDRLALFSRYLQQLVMESLGKERDLDGNVVQQGIAVYGNKGSTDQHAYVQQLRDGLPNFFATFVEVLDDGAASGIEVEDGTTSGDFLHGFFLGTRQALWDSGRPSITLTVDRVSAERVGALIALYERAVGLYAELVRVNAYHQPGVEAGKKAAAAVLDLQRRLLAALAADADGGTAEQLAARAGAPESVETALKVLERLAANPGRGVKRSATGTPAQAIFRRE
ncbi:MAG: glucose-6-phosphate isomerase [bacterium]|nr:glucose-6-phosphate isomerase [bacterium]